MTGALLVLCSAIVGALLFLFTRAVRRALDAPTLSTLLEVALLLLLVGVFALVARNAADDVRHGCIYRDVTITEGQTVYTGRTAMCPVEED